MFVTWFRFPREANLVYAPRRRFVQGQIYRNFHLELLFFSYSKELENKTFQCLSKSVYWSEMFTHDHVGINRYPVAFSINSNSSCFAHIKSWNKLQNQLPGEYESGWTVAFGPSISIIKPMEMAQFVVKYWVKYKKQVHCRLRSFLEM